MAMEAALVSVATGVLKPVIGKLTVLLGNEYKRFKTVRKEIKSLTHELAAMEAFLLKMSEDEDPDVQDKVWMNEVRELSYDMEDAIDDFMQSVGDKDEKPDGFIEKIKNTLGKLGKMKARRRIGREIQDLKKQIIEVGERNARYKTGVAISNSKNATIDPRALAIFEHTSKLVGIDEPMADILNLLREDVVHAPLKQEEEEEEEEEEEPGYVHHDDAEVGILPHSKKRKQQQQPKIVSIVGSGGMGKTTLANQVYQELKGQYVCLAFVSVSRNPDMRTILRTIFSQVAKKDYASTEAGNIQQLIINITDFLADKSYVVVVDDIWDADTWDIIKCAFSTRRSSGTPTRRRKRSCGTIITITRLNNVALLCCSSFNGHIYNMRPLDMVHSRQLFHTRLFRSDEDCPSYLRQVSEQILEKCDGLPLAIIAISGLLANTERTENIWNRVKDSIGRALERNPSVEGMMKILSLSYFDLPPYLKTCLLYLSIYLEDSAIKKKGLIRRWISEGFIHREGSYTAYELGERCFNELLNRGLIQPGETNLYGIVQSCRVHDTIIDFIISKSREENFVTLLGVPILKNGKQNKVVRRLCLHGVEEGNSTVPTTGLMLSHVRSLIVVRGLVEIPSLEEFRNLCVLDLRFQPLEEHHLENIVRLFQLRYLNIKGTKIRKLPEQIGRLGCLEILNLRHTYVWELPASIVNLRKLMHLAVDDGVKFPDGVGKMQALETLQCVNVAIQPFDFLCGLGQLKNLRNLQIDVVSDTKDTNEVWEEHNKAIVSSLCKLGTQNLRSLDIYPWSRFLHEPLCLPTLENLITESSVIPHVPRWVSSLRNLQQLHIQLAGVKQDDLCMLGALPSLLVMHLEDLKQPNLLIMHLLGQRMPNQKLRVSGEAGFRFLRIFIYDAHSEPVDLMFAAGSMPKLENLMLNSVGRVKGDCLDFGIENLPCLVTVKCVVGCNNFRVEAVKSAMERAASAHPNHPSLLFEKSWAI